MGTNCSWVTTVFFLFFFLQGANPCEHVGRCVNTYVSFHCQFGRDKAGPRSELVSTECFYNPCKNGGICIKRHSGLTCMCMPGFKGYRCEYDLNACDSNPCKNGATCENTPDGYECHCPKGYQCDRGLGTTWNDRMKDIMVSITGMIPPIEGIPVGKIISLLLKVLWPSSEKDIWSLIKDQVEGLIDQKILEFELQERNNELRALQKTMQMYVEAQIKEKGCLMSTMIFASNELFYKLTQSKNSVQLIPLVVTHSTQHLMILKERLLHGKEIYDEDNTNIWRQDLEDQISAYKDYIKKIYSEWVDWRKGKITLDLGYHTYFMLIPPFFRNEPYGNVYDELTQESVHYGYSGLVGPSDKNFYQNICEAIKRNMFGLRNGELLQILVTSMYLDNFIPGNEDNPSVIPESMSIASFGPISPSVQTVKNEHYTVYFPNNDNTMGGDVKTINVREWNILDGFQVIYTTGCGTFIGNSGGGQLHEVQLNNRRAKSLTFCTNNCNLIEVTIDFSNGESTGRLGNRGGWGGGCVKMGGIDTYGLYNVRIAAGGCRYGLYQAELDFKAYPTKPSQIDSQDLHLLNLEDGSFKYRSVIEGEIKCPLPP